MPSPTHSSRFLSPAQYWVSSTNHLAPRYAISSIPPLPRPSWSKYSPQHHVLKHPPVPFFLQCQRKKEQIFDINTERYFKNDMEGMKMRINFQEGKKLSGIQKQQLIPHARHSFFLSTPVLLLTSVVQN